MRHSIAFLLSFCVCASGLAQEADYDCVLRNGRIVDGTGNPWYYADVAIKGDRIARVARDLPGTAKKEIDASGLVVSPGFIDMHSHSDFLLFEDGDAQSKIRQGVTTDILGEGNSAGPFGEKLSDKKIDIQGQTVSIKTLSDYFDAVARAGISINVASYVGLNNVWESVMGQSFDRPSEDQLQQMEQLVEEAMKDGALGLSSQVMMPPGSLATTEDIIRLAKVAAKHGGIYSTHIRNEGLGVFESVKEAIEIGEKAQIPVDVIHLKIADEKYWGRMNEVISQIETARSRGINVQANVYPYTRGNNNLVSIIPPWAHEGGTEELIKRLKDKSQRPKLKRDIQDGLPGWYNHYTAVGQDWSRMLISDNNSFKGLTMDRVLAIRTENKRNADPLDELFDLLIEHNGSISTVYAHHTEEDMNLALRQPWCSIGSDGSAYSITGPLRRGNPHPRNFGTFPRVLGVYARELNLITLEDAVRKMTSLNAQKVGLKDRGVIREGAYADITVFDPKTIIDKSAYTDPFQYSEGVSHVLVNGQLVLENGDHTHARPGKALRKGP
jgi:N-acyl-D-aspartate/D-glutamate deacylase